METNSMRLANGDSRLSVALRTNAPWSSQVLSLGLLGLQSVTGSLNMSFEEILDFDRLEDEWSS